MPTPRYVVLYNGKEEQPDQKELKLTDSFESAKESHIEVKALMLNINYGIIRIYSDVQKRYADIPIL